MNEQADIAQRSLRYTRDQFGDVLQQTEHFVRENPTRAVGYALVAGFILNRLPIFGIFRSLLRLLFIALKPAVLAYGVTKIYQAAQNEEL
jgi:hypothetical protein